MSRKTVFLSLVLMILLVIYSRPFFKAQSLVELLEGNIHEVDSIYVLDLQNGHRNQMDESINSPDSIRLQEIVREANVKRVWDPFAKSDYSVTFSNHEIGFWISISRKGTIFIQDDVEKGYKFADKQLFEELLELLEKQ